ncbi:MAG TPA: amidohydrolase family protein [Gaiellaceae bacterium]|jgi:aminocarboxymuconate-semialdehyde decarboxylase
MTVIDVHAHYIAPFVLEEADGGDAVFGVRYEDGKLAHPQGFRYPVQATFHDTQAKLAEMDELGIDVTVWSSAPPLFFYDEEPAAGTAFARRFNDALAESIAGIDRLLGFATLPLADPEAAAAELERCVRELGFVGAQTGTFGAGNRPLDTGEADAALEAAARLGVPLMLHPVYVGPKPNLEDFYLTNSVGNPLDTCVAAARMMYAGVFDRFPDLRIVLVHAGGFMPFQLGRFDHAFAVRAEAKTKASGPPSSYLDHFWFDTITHSDASLRFLADLVGTERIVLGTDLPFDMADATPLERLRRADVDPDALGTTAAALLGL